MRLADEMTASAPTPEQTWQLFDDQEVWAGGEPLTRRDALGCRSPLGLVHLRVRGLTPADAS